MMNPRPANTGWRKMLAIGLVAMLLGFMLVTQIRTLSPTYEQMKNQSDTDRAAYLLQLYNNVVDLREQVGKMQAEVDSYQNDEATAAKLLKDVDELRAQNGELALVGGGITVDINGEVTMFDLQDLINELRNAGAEGITLNGKRVVLRTVIGGDGTSSYISIDNQPIHQPYRLQAIGSPSDLQTALERKGGLKQLLENKQGLTFKVARSESITLPKSSANYGLTYAIPVAPTPKAGN